MPGNGLVSWAWQWQQAITWTKVDPDLCHMMSRGHSNLTQRIITSLQFPLGIGLYLPLTLTYIYHFQPRHMCDKLGTSVGCWFHAMILIKCHNLISRSHHIRHRVRSSRSPFFSQYLIGHQIILDLKVSNVLSLFKSRMAKLVEPFRMEDSFILPNKSHSCWWSVDERAMLLKPMVVIWV